MTEEFVSGIGEERRAEPRTMSDRYYSVEFAISGAFSSYQFKLRNISAGGVCILVKDGSAVLRKLSVGDVVNMKYYIADEPNTAEVARTRIQHITKGEAGRYEGHYLVGLSILERLSPDTKIMAT